MNKKFSNSQILEIKHRFESPKLTPFRISNLMIFNLRCLIALKVMKSGNGFVDFYAPKNS